MSNIMPVAVGALALFALGGGQGYGGSTPPHALVRIAGSYQSAFHSESAAACAMPTAVARNAARVPESITPLEFVDHGSADTTALQACRATSHATTAVRRETRRHV